jgi:hypothetical protein
MALQLRKAASEIAMSKSTAKKQAAKAKNIKEQTTTIETRERIAQELKQREMGQRLNNIEKMYGQGTDKTQSFHNDFYGTRTIEDGSLFNQERTQTVLETISKTNMLNESEEKMGTKNGAHEQKNSRVKS